MYKSVLSCTLHYNCTKQVFSMPLFEAWEGYMIKRRWRITNTPWLLRFLFRSMYVIFTTLMAATFPFFEGARHCLGRRHPTSCRRFDGPHRCNWFPPHDLYHSSRYVADSKAHQHGRKVLELVDHCCVYDRRAPVVCGRDAKYYCACLLIYILELMHCYNSLPDLHTLQQKFLAVR